MPAQRSGRRRRSQIAMRRPAPTMRAPSSITPPVSTSMYTHASSYPYTRSVLLETRAEDTRAEHAAARQQAEDDHFIGVGNEEVKDSRLARQDDFTHDFILGPALKLRHVAPALGKAGQPRRQGQ